MISDAGIPKSKTSGGAKTSTSCFKRDMSIDALAYLVAYGKLFGGAPADGGKTVSSLKTLASPLAGSA
jgi:hypothetical protein